MCRSGPPGAAHRARASLPPVYRQPARCTARALKWIGLEGAQFVVKSLNA